MINLAKHRELNEKVCICPGGKQGFQCCAFLLFSSIKNLELIALGGNHWNWLEGAAESSPPICILMPPHTLHPFPPSLKAGGWGDSLAASGSQRWELKLWDLAALTVQQPVGNAAVHSSVCSVFASSGCSQGSVHCSFPGRHWCSCMSSSGGVCLKQQTDVGSSAFNFKCAVLMYSPDQLYFYSNDASWDKEGSIKAPLLSFPWTGPGFGFPSGNNQRCWSCSYSKLEAPFRIMAYVVWCSKEGLGSASSALVNVHPSWKVLLSRFVACPSSFI